MGPIISAGDFNPLGVEVRIYAHLERDSGGKILAKLTVRGSDRTRQTEMIRCLMAYWTSSALDLICKSSIAWYLWRGHRPRGDFQHSGGFFHGTAFGQ